MSDTFPTRDRSKALYARRFCVANEGAHYVGGFARYDIMVMPDRLWLTKQMFIEFPDIKGMEIITRGAIIKRYALQIVFRNHITQERDVAYVCDISFVGSYSRRRLDQLAEALGGALADVGMGHVAKALEAEQDAI